MDAENILLGKGKTSTVLNYDASPILSFQLFVFGALQGFPWECLSPYSFSTPQSAGSDWPGATWEFTTVRKDMRRELETWRKLWKHQWKHYNYWSSTFYRFRIQVLSFISSNCFFLELRVFLSNSPINFSHESSQPYPRTRPQISSGWWFQPI